MLNVGVRRIKLELLLAAIQLVRTMKRVLGTLIRAKGGIHWACLKVAFGTCLRTLVLLLRSLMVRLVVMMRALLLSAWLMMHLVLGSMVIVAPDIRA